jgi:hypothetical protein
MKHVSKFSPYYPVFNGIPLYPIIVGGVLHVPVREALAALQLDAISSEDDAWVLESLGVNVLHVEPGQDREPDRSYISFDDLQTATRSLSVLSTTFHDWLTQEYGALTSIAAEVATPTATAVPAPADKSCFFEWLAARQFGQQDSEVLRAFKRRVAETNEYSMGHSIGAEVVR